MSNLDPNPTYSINWCITWNNNPPDALKYLNELIAKQTLTYAIAGEETSENGTPHLQMFVQFLIRKRLSGVRKAFPTAWAQSMVSTPDAAVKYCKKNGKFHEFGVLSSHATAWACKWKKFREQAQTGDFANMEHGMYIRHYQTAWKIFSEVPDIDTSELEKPAGVWIWGVPCTGKTTTAVRAFPSSYFKDVNKWWDGYKGENNVIIDEFPQTCPGDLKRLVKVWGDRLPFTAEMKGLSHVIRPKLVIITTNWPLEEVYKGNTTDIGAMRKRFHQIHFDSYLRYTPEELVQIVENRVPINFFVDPKYRPVPDYSPEPPTRLPSGRSPTPKRRLKPPAVPRARSPVPFQEDIYITYNNNNNNNNIHPRISRVNSQQAIEDEQLMMELVQRREARNIQDDELDAYEHIIGMQARDKIAIANNNNNKRVAVEHDECLYRNVILLHEGKVWDSLIIDMQIANLNIVHRINVSEIERDEMKERWDILTNKSAGEAKQKAEAAKGKAELAKTKTDTAVGKYILAKKSQCNVLVVAAKDIADAAGEAKQKAEAKTKSKKSHPLRTQTFPKRMRTEVKLQKGDEAEIKLEPSETTYTSSITGDEAKDIYNHLKGKYRRCSTTVIIYVVSDDDN